MSSRRTYTGASHTLPEKFSQSVDPCISPCHMCLANFLFMDHGQPDTVTNSDSPDCGRCAVALLYAHGQSMILHGTEPHIHTQKHTGIQLYSVFMNRELRRARRGSSSIHSVKREALADRDMCAWSPALVLRRDASTAASTSCVDKPLPCLKSPLSACA